MKAFLAMLGMALLFVAPARAEFIEVLHVHGVINEGTVRYFKRGLALAKESHSPLLAVVLDTPGGLLTSTRSIVQAIGESPVPVLIFVAPGGASATSAGTIITMSAHFAGMAPGTNIGAAHPVGGQGEDIKGVMKEKAENDTVAFIRAQALLRGRNADWAEQAIRKSASVAADEALKLNVIDFVASDLPEALARIDGQTVHGGLAHAPGSAKIARTEGLALRDVPMTAAEKFLSFIGDPNVSYMLMTLGGLGIYIELTSGGGAIFPGILGVICLILAFISFSTLPVNTGGVALLLIGFALFALEPFIVSYGALTIGGIIALVLGALFLIDPTTGDLRLSLALVLPTVLAFAVITFAIGYYALRSRRTVYGGLDSFADFQGIVQSVDESRHSGRCLIRGESWEFELSHPQHPVHVGDQLTVVRREHMKLIVKKHTN